MPAQRDHREDGERPSRGRRPTFDRDAALDIALEQFWRHGYDGVGIADLTKAIGIAPPSLYHAFGSKADLYREVLRRYGSLGLSSAGIEASESSYQAVASMLERGAIAVTRPGRPLGCMISSGLLMTSAENATLACEIRELRAVARVALEERIRRDIAKKLLPAKTDAAALARFYTTVLQGMSVQALDGATVEELMAVAATAMKAWPK